MHAYKEEEIEYSSKHQAVVSSSGKPDGELSDGEEVDDEYAEERGLVDGKIRRDDEYDEDEDYEGIAVDASFSYSVVYPSLSHQQSCVVQILCL